MATNLPSSSKPSNLFAAVDMGTNSFKMVIVRSDPTGKFLTIDRIKQPVVLGRDMPSSVPNPSLSTLSQSLSLQALNHFKEVLNSHKIQQARFAATSAVREATNKAEFVDNIRKTLRLDVEVLSGEEEAKLVYLGILQFLPIYSKIVLAVDIGGGSTEFVIGFKGEVLFATSLKLGHVSLTERFVKNNEIADMRLYIQSVIEESGLVNKVKELGFEMVVGSSGTIKAIEKAIFSGYGVDVLKEFQREWRFSKLELSSLVERLCSEEEKVLRDGFFKRRSEFIVAGAILLEEIFEVLGIEEMEVSGYALAEGMVTEVLARVYSDYDINANARWRSVVRLASRFNSEKRMKSAAQCAGLAKEIFDGLRMYGEVSLEEKDVEYLEAACLLHNIGLFTGKKGYHKQSFHIIMNGSHLHGYTTEEVKLIALLVRYHRKKFPKFGHDSLQEFPKEVKRKFAILCAIIRISVLLQQYSHLNFQEVEVSHCPEGFKLVLNEIKDQPLIYGTTHPSPVSIEKEIVQELEHFRKVFQQTLMVIIPPSSTLES